MLYAASTGSLDFTIGILPLESSGIDANAFVLETGQLYCPVYSNGFDGYLSSKIQSEKEKETEISIHNAYTEEKDLVVQEVTTVQGKVEEETYDTFPILYKPLESKVGLASIFASGDQGLEWYCLSNGLDALLLVSSRKISDYSRVIVEYYARDTKARKTIFDQLCLNQNLYPFQENLALSLLKATGRSDVAVISFDNAPVGLEVSANGNPLEIISSKAFVPAGEYELGFSAFAYVGKTLVVEVSPDSVTSVNASLTLNTYGNLYFSSLSGNASWFVDGKPFGFSTGFELQDYTLPLVAAVAKDGFVLKAIQTRKAQDSLAFDLKPLWMDDTNLIGEAQKTFYGSLQRTILLFGIYVACTTLSDTTGFESQVWQPILVATSGFTLVSSVNLIKNLASYAFLARTNNR
jgi:hypothetical protein